MSQSIKFYLVIILFSSISFSTRSQPVLSNHTFSNGNNQVGIVSLPDMDAIFKLSGANAGLFRLKANKLYIRKGSIKPEIKWYEEPNKAAIIGVIMAV